MQENIIPVSTLGEYLKNIIDAETLLYKIKVFGEISSYNVSNGNAFFIVKDEKAVLNCAMFVPSAYVPNVGDKVIVTGTPKYYVKGGKLTFAVDKIEEYGKGDIFEQLQLLKQKLEREGLFDVSHKKQMPEVINTIGVVTAENGAVIHDIINVATRRNKNIQIVLFPTKVQGEGADKEIAKGIDYFSKSNVDAVIVGRGGGSEEDLMPYNSELVARSAYNCSKFLVSAVGHETNYTLIDYVADLRAPTPSAAAEILVKEVVGLIERFTFLKERLFLNINNILKNKQEDVELSKTQLIRSTINVVNQNQSKLNLMISSLKSNNPLNILDKGYARILKNNEIVSSINQVNKNDNLLINLKDGTVEVEVNKINGKF